MNDDEDFVPEQDEPEPEIDHGTTNRVGAAGPMLDEPPGPINWNLLTADDAEAAWLELNQWVNWLRTTYGLPSSVVPSPLHGRITVGSTTIVWMPLLSVATPSVDKVSSMSD